MAQDKPTTTAPETVTVRALVTLTVAPQEGQTPEDAATKMLRLFTEYITEKDSAFLTDYGTTPEKLQKYRTGDGDLDDDPTWGGYEGPFVLESKVDAVA